jgi:hypothetical protein
MTDEALSTAVVTYIWGRDGLPWPGHRPEALEPEQIKYLPLIREAIAVAFADDQPQDELQVAVARRTSLLRTAHPDLSEEAVRAIGSLYAYCTK